MYGKQLTIINLYGPNKDDISILKKLNNFLIGGDFKIVLNNSEDKNNSATDSHKLSRKTLLNIMDTFNLTDIWRTQHPNKTKFTWHSNSKPPIFCRLDYFLISDNLQNSVAKTDIKSSYKSDHSLISIDLNLNETPKGPGVFKLNNSLLLDTDYQNTIRNSLKTVTDFNKECNPNVLWELIKGSIRNESIKFSSLKKKQQIKREKEINKTIEDLENKIINSSDIIVKQEATDKLIKAKQELTTIIDHKIRGIIIRAKAESVEFNEKNSKYFSNLEKKNAEKNLISQLNVNGTNITDQD